MDEQIFSRNITASIRGDSVGENRNDMSATYLSQQASTKDIKTAGNNAQSTG